MFKRAYIYTIVYIYVHSLLSGPSNNQSAEKCNSYGRREPYVNMPYFGRSNV